MGFFHLAAWVWAHTLWEDFACAQFLKNMP
jgi:hypothetical protein